MRGLQVEASDRARRRRTAVASPADAAAFAALARRLRTPLVAREHVPYRDVVDALAAGEAQRRLTHLVLHSWDLCDDDDVARCELLRLVAALLEQIAVMAAAIDDALDEDVADDVAPVEPLLVADRSPPDVATLTAAPSAPPRPPVLSRA